MSLLWSIARSTAQFKHRGDLYHVECIVLATLFDGASARHDQQSYLVVESPDSRARRYSWVTPSMVQGRVWEKRRHVALTVPSVLCGLHM